MKYTIHTYEPLTDSFSDNVQMNLTEKEMIEEVKRISELGVFCQVMEQPENIIPFPIPSETVPDLFLNDCLA